MQSMNGHFQLLMIFPLFLMQVIILSLQMDLKVFLGGCHLTMMVQRCLSQGITQIKFLSIISQHRLLFQQHPTTQALTFQVKMQLLLVMPLTMMAPSFLLREIQMMLFLNTHCQLALMFQQLHMLTLSACPLKKLILEIQNLIVMAQRCSQLVKTQMLFLNMTYLLDLTFLQHPIKGMLQ